MLARLRKTAKENEGGFTLIELLVVMIIIGILAAIAIPAFLNQKKKARETSAKADVTTIGKEVAAFYVDGTGPLTLTHAAGDWKLASGATEVAKGKLSDRNETGPSGSASILSGDKYCVQVVNLDSPTGIWKFSAAKGLDKSACGPADIA